MPLSGQEKHRALYVERDRAHARVHDAVRRGATVWTWRELVDRLASWVLFHDGGVRDDRAPLWALASALGPLAPIAHDADDLRRALVHGGATAAEIAKRIEHKELAALFAALARADDALAASGRVDGGTALSRAVARLERGEIPAVMRGFDSVTVDDVVDPSSLELRALIALARAGVPIKAVVPVDGLSRGLLAGVEPVLRALEAAHDSALEIDLVDVAEPLPGQHPALAAFSRAFYGARDLGEGARARGRVDVDDAAVDETATPRAGSAVTTGGVELALAADEAAEARDVADVVAAWHRADTGAIAVALRTIDDGAARIADALEAHGVPARVRRRKLASSAAARLILDVVALARDGSPRDRVLAVLSSPAFLGALSSSEGARVLRVLRLAAARGDVEDANNPSGGYRHRLSRFKSGLLSGAGDMDPADVDRALEHVERALALAARIPREAPLLEHLRAVRSLATTIFEDGTDVGCAQVRDVLDDAIAACAAVRAGAPVALSAFAVLLERTLERAQGPASDVDDDRAVEILALPELWGRRFAHVVVAGCVEGRLPKTERSERLLADVDRMLVNKAAGRPVLRLLDDDPLEPSPLPRAQALEPLWMIGALRAASTSLLLTAPRRDGRGRELSPSVFLLEAERALGVTGHRFAREPSPRAVAVRAAALRAAGALDDDRAHELGIDAAILHRADLAKRLITERARFFRHKRSATRASNAVDGAVAGAPRVGDVLDATVAALIEASGPYAFAVDPARMATSFAPSFGLTAERPLTPTRLEALAECRMHGFMQHVLKVDVDAPGGNAADARVLGTLAHAVMERFYTERKARGVPAARVDDADRERVRVLVGDAARALVATGHLAAIHAQVAWLETALVRAVSMLARDPRVADVEPDDFEVRIGVPGPDDVGGGLGSAPLVVGGRTLWLGGVIDRVDEGEHARVVIDYKTASTGSIRRKITADALFDKHFQLLLYLRLLEHHRPTPPEHALHGYLVSLRDGTTSSDVAELPDLRARVLDDARGDGLASGVGRVLLPILGGVIPPDAGDRCDTCRLQRVCRVPLAAEFAPDLDDDDATGGV